MATEIRAEMVPLVFDQIYTALNEEATFLTSILIKNLPEDFISITVFKALRQIHHISKILKCPDMIYNPSFRNLMMIDIDILFYTTALFENSCISYNNLIGENELEKRQDFHRLEMCFNTIKFLTHDLTKKINFIIQCQPKQISIGSGMY